MRDTPNFSCHLLQIASSHAASAEEADSPATGIQTWVLLNLQAMAPMMDERAAARAARKAAPETAGRRWFDLPATPITPQASTAPPLWPSISADDTQCHHVRVEWIYLYADTKTIEIIAGLWMRAAESAEVVAALTVPATHSRAHN